MDLLDLLKKDGFNPKWAASTNDGEYKGACPFCGGVDRFCVWPKRGNGGKYWCRQCERYGDTIQYLIDFRDMHYRDACLHLNLPLRWMKVKPRSSSKFTRTPKQSNMPNDTWQSKARKYIEAAKKELWIGKTHPNMKWLRDRGLTERTIKKAWIGWHPTDIWKPRKDWGLPEKIEGGKRKKLWLPAGLVIPYIHDGKIIRVRIRRHDSKDEYGRYIFIPGGDARPMFWPGDRNVYIVVESELDGLLLWQEIKGSIGIIALGSTQVKPDTETNKVLSQANQILVALDSDKAGVIQSWRYWLKQYKQAKWWPIPCKYGKDPAEAVKSGLDLRNWVQAGMT